jgi:hypothetical protein
MLQYNLGEEKALKLYAAIDSLRAFILFNHLTAGA